MAKNKDETVILKGIDNEEMVVEYSFDATPALLIGTADTGTHSEEFDPDVFDVDFEEHVTESHKLDYSVAAASGLLCSMLDIFWVGQFSLQEAQQVGSDHAEKFVMHLAKKKGYKGKTLEGAIKHLEKKYPMPGDPVKNQFGGGLQHHFRDFTHHPTILGLFFSLFAQFTGLVCGTDEKGCFKTVPVPEKEMYIGKDVPQKILFGTVHWLFHLASDMAGSHEYAGEGTGIPGPILSFLKELSALPVIRDLKVKYKNQASIHFYQWLSKLFNGTFFWDKEKNQSIRFDLRTEMGIANYLLKQATPVIANECIVRGFYFISRLVNELKTKDINSIKDIGKIESEKILPINNKVLIRMLTISIVVFEVVDIGQAAVKARKDSIPTFFGDLISRINIPGIGRFVFAIKADAKYIFQDIKEKYDSYQHRIYTIHKELYEIPEWNTVSVTSEQAAILYSLEYQMLLDDLNTTTGKKALENKRHWISVWKETMNKILSAKSRSLFEDEQDLYLAINNEAMKTNNISWLYTITLEALQFKPYTKLSEGKENPYKGLKLNNDYLHKVYVTRQDYINKKELSKTEKTYANYRNALQNNNAKIAAGVAGTIVAAAATGGAALFFAPEIATALVGGSFAGIYGAALTNASLAAIGGGALAAGGLGVAGGTAIIAGGGAAVGLVSGGAITASSALFGTSKDLTLDMLTKVLTIANVAVINRYHRKDVVNALTKNMELMISKMEHDIEVMKDDLPKLEGDNLKALKKRIKTSKESLVYMSRCQKELVKLQK